MKKIVIIFLIGLLNIGSSIAQTVYTPVDAGSKVHFVIKNFGIRIGGDFTGLQGTIKFDPANLSAGSFAVTVDANTIDTDNKTRDGHLRKSEYLDVAKYKTIHFASTRITKSTTAGRYYMFGNLTIKGVTKPAEFGFSATPKDNGYLFEGEFEINRRDFGVGGSSMSMADKLKLSLSVFAKK
jgi:polyisoprenoid-binding protein YceI